MRQVVFLPRYEPLTAELVVVDVIDFVLVGGDSGGFVVVMRRQRLVSYIVLLLVNIHLSFVVINGNLLRFGKLWIQLCCQT